MPFIDRDGNEDINWNRQDLFPTCAKVRNVENVIDIMLINHYGYMMSMDPVKFVEKINQTEYPSVTNKWATFRCNDDSNEPIPSRTNSRGTISDNMRSLWDRGGGAYQDNDEQVNMSKTDSKSGDINTWRSGWGWKAMKQSDPVNDNEGNCTEFSVLYHRLDCVQSLFQKGYRLFVMDNYNHYRNWVMYDHSSSGKHYNYFLCMYLSAENLAKELGCFNESRSDMRNIVSRLFNADQQKLTNSSNMKSLANEFCGKAFPSYSYLTVGDYNMGTTIYSPNTKYKFIVQPDGNMVIYELKATSQDAPSTLVAIWNSNTSQKAIRPILCIQDDGNIVLHQRVSNEVRKLAKGAVAWAKFDTRGTDVKLGLSNSGDLFVFQMGNNRDFKILKTNGKSSDKLTKEINSDVSMFYDKCTADSNWGVSKSDMIDARSQMCKLGTNIYELDDCRRYFSDYTIAKDQDNQYKKDMDDYVVKTICKSGYDSTNSKLVEFCSCVAPIGDSLQIFKDAKYHPKCWEEKCMVNGYKTYSMKDIDCPDKVCIQNVNLQNVVVKAGAKVSQTCEIAGDQQTAPATPEGTTTGASTTSSATGGDTASSGTTVPAAESDTASTSASVPLTKTQEIIYVLQNPTSNLPLFIAIVGLLFLLISALFMGTGTNSGRSRISKRAKKRETVDALEDE